MDPQLSLLQGQEGVRDSWSSGASQARFSSRGLSRARSEAAVEKARLLLEASVIEFREGSVGFFSFLLHSL